MKITEKEIGRRIQMRRESLHLSQAEVADRMGVATSTVSRLEAGALNATFQTLLAICDALHVELYTLLDIVPPPQLTPRQMLAYLRTALNDQEMFEALVSTLSTLPEKN